MAEQQGAFVVMPEFEVKPDCMAAFLDLARFDASSSVEQEPGCRQFDVVVVEDEPNLVVFYEIYDSRAAFDAHLQTPHLARFRAEFPALVVAQRRVRFATRVGA